MHGARADARRHRQRVARRQRRRIAAGALGEQRREPHLLEHVEVVVRRRAVGADADVDAELQHARHRRDAGAELEVARRVVRDARIEVLQRADLAFVHVHAVRREHLRLEQPVLLHPRHDRHAVLSTGRLDLERRFGEVDVQRHVELGGQLRARAQDFRRAGVGRVRRRRRDDQRMAAPALDEVARARERVLVARRVGRREAEHRLPAQRAHAGVGRRLRDRILEVVHVGEGGDAGPDHLGAGELGAERDEVGAHEFALDRHHVAHQPDVEAQIVGEPAQERHRRVRVRVDEPRHHDASAAVDRLGGRVRIGVGADRCDGITRNGDGAAAMDREAFVHRQDDGVGEPEIAGRHGLSSIVCRRCRARNEPQRHEDTEQRARAPHAAAQRRRGRANGAETQTTGYRRVCVSAPFTRPLSRSASPADVRRALRSSAVARLCVSVSPWFVYVRICFSASWKASNNCSSRSWNSRSTPSRRLAKSACTFAASGTAASAFVRRVRASFTVC